MKKANPNKKYLQIGIVAVVAVLLIVVLSFFLSGKFAGKATYTFASDELAPGEAGMKVLTATAPHEDNYKSSTLTLSVEANPVFDAYTQEVTLTYDPTYLKANSASLGASTEKKFVNALFEKLQPIDDWTKAEIKTEVKKLIYIWFPTKANGILSGTFYDKSIEKQVSISDTLDSIIDAMPEDFIMKYKALLDVKSQDLEEDETLKAYEEEIEKWTEESVEPRLEQMMEVLYDVYGDSLWDESDIFFLKNVTIDNTLGKITVRGGGWTPQYFNGEKLQLANIFFSTKKQGTTVVNLTQVILLNDGKNAISKITNSQTNITIVSPEEWGEEIPSSSPIQIYVSSDEVGKTWTGLRNVNIQITPESDLPAHLVLAQTSINDKVTSIYWAKMSALKKDNTEYIDFTINIPADTSGQNLTITAFVWDNWPSASPPGTALIPTSGEVKYGIK